MSLPRVLLATFVFYLLSVTTRAQITSVSDPTSTPVPGAGHDYVKLLSETVNPATGALSVRISVPVPPGRKLSVPFAFTYDSSGAWFLEAVAAGNQPPVMSSNSNSNLAPMTWGGWSTTFPQLSRVLFQQAPNHPVIDGHSTCDALTGYVFTDPSGARHSLGLSHWYNSSWQACQPTPFSEYATGGDDFYQAALVGASNSVSNYDGTPEIAAPDGTVYNFGSFFSCMDGNAGDPGSLPPLASGLPVSIEDRNGNIVTITTDANHNGCSGFIATDTLGRTALSVSQYGYTVNSNTTSTISVSGLTQPYTVTWQMISPTGLSISHSQIGSANCYAPPTSAAAWTPLAPSNTGTYVVTAITLPNGEQYKFGYDSATGFVNKITYPSEGFVSYTWGINPNSSGIQYNDKNADPAYCAYLYDTPAIVQRSVSFDGSTVALTQSFNYTPTNWGTLTPVVSPHLWVSKQTTVTTTDNLRGTTSKIIYNYVPNTVGFFVPNLNSNTNYFVNAVAVESTTSYYGYSPNYPLLRTETKAWADQFELACDLTTLNDGSGQISGVFYGYSRYGGQIIDKKEYDYGQLSSTSSCPGGGTLPTPARETVTTFQTFAATPIYPSGPSIFDRPSSIKIYGNGTLTAETDYSYDQTGVATASTPAGTHDETNYSASSTSPRGNATAMIRQCIQTCTNPVTTYTYDETGQALSMTDPCGNATCSDMSGTNHTTTYSYVDNYASGTGTPPGQTNAYLTQITYPNTGVAHTESFSWGYNDGQLRSSTDQNSQTTTYTYNTPPSGCSYPDGFDRLSSITYPDTGKTTYCYNDAPYNSSTPSPSVTTSKAINSSANLTTLIAFDGLGHVKQTQLTSDPQGTVYADTTYDALGRVWKQSNPYRSGSAPTDGTTTYIYDALGRNCVVVPPDGSAVTNNTCPATHPANDVLTVYVGNTTTVTDQYGIKRQSVTDALGRLTQVFEDPGGLNYETDYAYDALDNLLCTAQKGTNSGTFTNCASIPAAWRPRTFTYDPLSRLLSATNPESGNITYSYDANGNLGTKTAPAPDQTSSATVTTTYSYDALNRLTQKSYSDSSTPAPTPTAYFLYDLVNPWGSTYPNNSYIGRLDETITKNGSGTWLTSSYFLHDPMGRITKIGQCTPTHCSTGFHTVYTYDLIGDLASFRTIENNITFTYSYNAAGRPIKVTSSLADANHPATLATVNASIGYWAFGGLHMLTLGNGLTETSVYNSRLQPCRMNVNSSGAWYNQCTAALASGNVQDFTYGFSLGASDNGNLTSFSASGAGTFNRTYSYGQLNRLSSMSAPGDPSGCTGLSWTYDPWGNRSDQTVTSGTCGTFHASITTKNQLYDPVHNIYQYDAAGNMTYDGSHTYFYDAENRIIQVGGTLGNCSTATACYAYDAQGNRVQKTVGSAVTQYVLDTSGQAIHEADGSGNFATYYIFFGAKLLAQYKNSTTQFIHKDHLGSTRLVTGMTNPSTAVDALDYLPFGEQITGDTATTHKFTGKERDTETGLDNFGARYHGSSLGRLMSPDPLMIIKQKFTDPQQWNMYSYARNNPLRFIDPTGKYVCSDERKCATFEKARREALKSKDKDVVRAANAYGKLGDKNGVYVSFADKLGGDRGGTVTRHDTGLEYDPSSPNQVRAAVNVTIQSDQASNQETLVHEGSHVADRQDFVKSLLPNGTSSDPSLNLTLRQSEVRAYELSIQYAQRGNKTLNFGPCGLMDECKFPPGMMPAQRDERINELLDDPRNHYDNLDNLLFPEFKQP